MSEGEARLTPGAGRELIARMERAMAEVEAVVTGVPADQLTAPGPGGDWSAKDHLAHLLTWARVALSRAAGGYSAEAEAPIFGVDVATYQATRGDDALNELAQRVNRAKSLDQVLAELRDAHARLLATVSKLGEAELARPWLPERPERGPLIDVLAGNTYAHYREHAGYIARLLGR